MPKHLQVHTATINYPPNRMLLSHSTGKQRKQQHNSRRILGTNTVLKAVGVAKGQGGTTPPPLEILQRRCFRPVIKEKFENRHFSKVYPSSSGQIGKFSNCPTRGAPPRQKKLTTPLARRYKKLVDSQFSKSGNDTPFRPARLNTRARAPRHFQLRQRGVQQRLHPISHPHVLQDVYTAAALQCANLSSLVTHGLTSVVCLLLRARAHTDHNRLPSGTLR